MDTISKTRKMRKFGSLAAGVVLCLGIANMPSALAADGVMTTNPSSGWVQGGKTALRIEGTGCVGSKANPVVDVIVSETASMDDGWSISVNKGAVASTINEDGTWNFALTTTTDPTTNTWMSALNGLNGLSTIYAWCVDANENAIVAYDPVDVAITGIRPFSVMPGEDTAVEADGFTPGNTVTFTLSGGTSNGDLADMVIGSGTVDEYGHVDATVNVPASVETGYYTLTVSDGIRSWVSEALFIRGLPTTTPAPTPSVPDSSVAKDSVKASTTGGAARLADGKDSYTLVTTVVDDNGTRLAGLADRLTAQIPDGVTVGSFTDNGDGTYSVKVTSADPGNYQIVILLDGDPVGDPVPVNFIGADIAQASRTAGEQQSADGLGFLPGEKVTVTVHSDPIDLGTLTADENGKVSVSFEVLASLGVGAHSVEFAGAVSGTVSVAFDVTAPAGAAPAGKAPAGTAPAGTTPAGTTPAGTAPAGAAPAGTAPAGTTPAGTTPTVDVNTGGTVASSASPLVGLVACLLVAGVALATTARARLRHRSEA